MRQPPRKHTPALTKFTFVDGCSVLGNEENPLVTGHIASDSSTKDKKASETGGGVRKDKLADDVSGNACFELTLKGEGAHGRGAGESAQEDAGQEAASMNKPAKKHKKIVKF